MGLACSASLSALQMIGVEGSPLRWRCSELRLMLITAAVIFSFSPGPVRL